MKGMENNSEYALGLRETTEKRDRVGRARDLSDPHRILPSGLTFKYKLSSVIIQHSVSAAQIKFTVSIRNTSMLMLFLQKRSIFLSN